jgi:hypothetical protein
MGLVILLATINSLSIGLSSSYITKVEKIAGLPVSVVFLMPTIEYGLNPNLGCWVEDFYVSLDCNDSTQQIYAELGANCLMVGPFYRKVFNTLEAIGTVGFLRIDVAALISGEMMGYSFAGQINEERNGGFLGCKVRYRITDILRVLGFTSFGIVEAGNFLEYGATLTFMPFINRKLPDYLKPLSVNTGISIAHLGAVVAEGESYNFKFGYYLVGVSYELGKQEAKPSGKQQKQ